MNTFTSFLGQPGTCLGSQGSQRDLQGDICFTKDPGTAIYQEGIDRKAGSWFENQVELYKKKLREPHRYD